MQTFLPYPDFIDSLLALDKKRLGKQRVEAWQILDILLFPNKFRKSKAWFNHPAVLMWKGYEDALIEYYNISLEAFEYYGGNNIKLKPIFINYKPKYPKWLGNEKFHASHRSNLLRKDLTFYSKYGWIETDDLEYVWPSKEGLM